MLIIPGDEDDVVISLDIENPDERVKRIATVVFFGVAVCALVSRVPEVGLRLIIFLLIAIATAVIISRLGVQRALVLRSRDLFTRGGEIDEPVPWSSISAVSASGTGLVLNDRERGTLELPLHFLPVLHRYHAIQRIIRYHELFQHEGPIRRTYPVSLDAGGGLRLHPCEWEDRELFQAVSESQENIALQLHVETSHAMAEAVFRSSLSLDAAAMGWIRFTLKVDDEGIGFISYQIHDPLLRHAIIGIDLLPERCNQGHGTRAIKCLLEHLLTDTNLITVTAGCFSDNFRCRRALEKAGFDHAGSFPRFWFKEGAWKTGEIHQIDLATKRKSRCEP